ncbi:non-ribosomal peptide synthetase [Paenibacillus sp. PAMC 26794]|uniref:non-ribosomal peptide synthetase n=1 Tax=Paenibacillus sp. PAMC 26794 TaxID=1257080 RepID=UPI0002E53EF8|nr:non-ribosomal peptide synthetase [Paenibacillus sp. PAMC 26794]
MLKKIEKYRLSPQQERIWKLWQSGQHEAFLTRAMMLLNGDVDPMVLQATLHEMVARHDALKSTFQSSPYSTRPVQVTEGSIYFEWGERESGWQFHSADEQRLYLDHLFTQFSEKAFKQGKRLWLQAELVKLSSDKHVLMIAIPTMLIENALQPFFKELAWTYDKHTGHAVTGTGEELFPKVMLSDRNDESFEMEASREGRNFWATRDFISAFETHLPFANLARDGNPFSARTLIWEVPSETVDEMTKLAMLEGTEESIVLMAAWQSLLALLTGESVVVGVAYDERSDEEMTGSPAIYVPLEGRFDRGDSFRSVLGMVNMSAEESREWQGSFSWEGLKAGSDVSYLPFGYDFSDLQKTHTTGEWMLTVLRQSVCSDLFDLRLSGIKLADGRFTIEFHYDANILSDSDVERLSGYFQRLLAQVLKKPESPIACVKLVSQEEQEQLLVGWNETSVQFPHHQALHELFEAQVVKNPDHIAVLSGEWSLTYEQLNNRANCLAYDLRTNGIASGSVVGIACERSMDMIIGMLAVLKAGGAYLPIDTAYPMDRITYMLQDSRTEVLLTQQDLADRFVGQSVEVILLDNKDRANLVKETWDNLNLQITGEQPAYVIYTSGSTGQAKGIVMGHAAICNHMHWMQAEFPLGASDRVLQKTAFSFDASVWEFYAPLLAGAQLVFPKPGTHLDPATLVQEMQEHCVSILQVVPTMLNMLIEQEGFAHCTTLSRVFVGGEQLTRQLQERLYTILPNVDLINLYGPTECCIDSTYWVADPGGSGHVVPIGRPIANVQVYVLDEYLQPVPQGVAGELYIGGAGLAMGYLHRPELTSERFLVHPFAEGERFYKSGDLVRMLPGGALEFLGRMDDQVKLHGLRIELGEIESVLQRHEAIQQAVVLLREDKPGHPLLVAYVVCKGEHPQVQELRLFLNGQLPEYMVPSFYVYLNALPLMPNGKVDRRQYPQPSLLAQGEETDYVAPRNLTEELMAGIWSDVLDLPEVGIQHDFFELGGDSLAALKILALCKREGIYLTPTDMFKLRRIEDIAAAVETRTNARDQQKSFELPIGGSN